jgi:hypothetical protein
LAAIGRNDPCPCGSGQKYKHCHINDPTGVLRDMSVRARNQILLNAAEDIFGFRKGRTWADFKRNISGKEVRNFYEVQASLWPLWPLETNWSAVMPQASAKLRALYLGEIEPRDIVRNLVRFSLYSDELLAVDPFHNPWHLRPEYNPIDNPDQYKSDTLRLVYFLSLVSPWIRSGLLQLIPNPSDFYPGLRQETWRRAKIRWGDRKPSPEDLTEGHLRGREEMSRVVQALPPNRLFRLAEEATGKALTDEQKSALLPTFAESFTRTRLPTNSR